jgi:hypothetical protein
MLRYFKSLAILLKRSFYSSRCQELFKTFCVADRRPCVVLFCFQYYTAVYLKLGSAKGCQGFLETTMRNGGTVWLVVLNLYVRIKIRVATFDANHSVTDITQTTNRCFHPEATWSCSEAVSTARHRQCRCVSLAVDILHVTYMKDK